jgi:two-component system chemotaxis sensor kinase CheA
MSQEKLEKIDLWVTQATREIELSEPGTDRSQFPLRDLFSSIAEKSGDLPGLEEFHKAANHTAELIETILFSGESYTAGQLETLANLATQLADLRSGNAEAFVPPAEPAQSEGASAELEKIDLWLSQASREILLSEPGTDRSQFPLRDLFGSIEEKSRNLPGLEEFHKAAEHTNSLIEEILFSGKNYTAEQLETLGALASQLEDLRSGNATVFNPPASAPQAASPTAPAAPKKATAVAEVEGDEYTSINLEADGDILHEFSNEAREHLDNIEQGVLVLEDQPDDAEMLSSIFRAFHTFKGASGFLRLMPVNRLSHELENLLDLARSGKLVLNPFVIDLILEGRDVLKKFTEELQLQLSGEKPVEPIHVAVNKLVQRVRGVIENPTAPPTAPTPSETEEGKPDAPAPKSSGGGDSVKAVSNVMKVDTRKFDSLVELVGELVIAQSQVSQHPDLVNLGSRQVTRNLSQLSTIALELQKIAMSLRMVAIKGTFQKMIRLVRDLNASTGKSVDLVITGEDTEMDRTMVEELADPLMHMIRNSVDHGIEPLAKRLESGKSEKGTVRLSAFHQGGSIVVEIADDGAGLNTRRILDKAVERGIVPAGATLSDKEIFDLIFAPGFSTAETITGISGRGVGMDVVKQNIAKMRGKIEIDSVPGSGTTFRIFLPLTLAIIDGLIARVGDERFIFPTLSVCESFRPTPQMITRVQGKGEVVKVRDRLCPILRLYDHFQITPRTTEPCEGLLIVVESANQRRCIMVDELIGKQEVVIKSLDERFKSNKCVAGAAIMGDGRVGLILDARELVQAAAPAINLA